MPSVSKSQQQAAAIALHAPKSELRGSSKEMAKSMTKDELHKFAKTKRKGLPAHVSDSVGRIKAMIAEGRHKEGCTCGFCQNMRLLQGRKKEGGDKKEDSSEETMQEGRDDIKKLPISPEGKAYARRGGLASMKRQPKDYINMVAAETNQKAKEHGFKNYDGQEFTGGRAVGSTPVLAKKKHESKAERVVARMLD
jgi:Protein of unknwon function (DUF3008)